MKLWLLRPAVGATQWDPWYDKACGFVIRAETGSRAREIAQHKAGDEGGDAWADPASSTCDELSADGLEGVVMIDFRSA